MAAVATAPVVLGWRAKARDEVEVKLKQLATHRLAQEPELAASLRAKVELPEPFARDPGTRCGARASGGW